MSEYSPFNARDKIYTSSAGFLIQMEKGETGHYEVWRGSPHAVTRERVWYVGFTGSSAPSEILPKWMTVA